MDGYSNLARSMDEEGTKPRLRINKPAIRVLGVAESFEKGMTNSILAGVVMRSDFIMDGISISRCTVGGMDATESIISLYRKLNRTDINAIMLSGCIISWYNVIDLHRVYEEIGRPLVCITYEESYGIRDFFIKNFPEDWMRRVEVYERNGSRTSVKLKTGYSLFVRAFGMDLSDAKKLLDRFTLHGRIPEPIRLSKMIAREVCKYLKNL